MSEATTSSETRERAVRQPPFAAPHVFVLAVVAGDDPGAVYRLTGRETVFGRGVEADVSIDDETISTRHCSIRADGSLCKVLDLGSRNGTMVNGRPLREGIAERLRHLDEIQVGDTRLLFLTGRFRPGSER